MKNWLFIMASLAFCRPACAQSVGDLPPFTEWYENPLGVYPLELHTSHALILPALAATACLLLTRKDSLAGTKFTYFGEAGFSKGYHIPNTSVWQTNAGALFHARRWLALGVEFNTTIVHDAFNDTWGVGIRPFIRWYPVNGENFRLFFESGAGLVCMMTTFPKPTSGYGEFSDPRTGTRINGSPKYGVGAEVNLTRELSLLVGVRHTHFSNGNARGSQRNPGHDSNGVYVGLSFHR